MHRALALAQQGAKQGEVPVGAVVVRDNSIIGEGFNCPIRTRDPTAHAEMVALREAAQQTGNYRLPGCTLYVTIEPCTMCCGAMVHARMKHVIFGAAEPKAGAIISHPCIFDDRPFNHPVTWSGGLLAAEAAQLLTTFFKQRRTT